MNKPKYLESYGMLCPYCGSDAIVSGAIDYGHNQIWQQVTCNDCEKEWTDIYTLTDVEEIEL